MAASVGLGTTVAAPAVAGGGRRLGLRRRVALPPPSARVARPSATKSVTAVTEKGLFDTIFGALYKEEQLLETDPILNKVDGKAAAAPAAASRNTKAGRAAAKKAAGDGGFSFGTFFSKKE
ncbi:uncharacterized protein LOC102713652 [Oryza brachyantha]|uniref:uncharacterized protein LOC102713652 n=1 Tax=Oryza brachyantha TaxID=4533 RepID=UPI001ADB2749|nr:uncharacterized protein LOC102713652 [Oryza brachyantha]